MWFALLHGVIIPGSLPIHSDGAQGFVALANGHLDEIETVKFPILYADNNSLLSSACDRKYTLKI